jgi:phosphatidylglycerophosphatase C
MSVPLAVFDLDGTITRGDTYVPYLRHILARRLERIPNCVGLPMAVLHFKLGHLTNDEIKRAFLDAIVGGCSRTEVECFTATFVADRFTRMIKQKAVARIDCHRRQGHLLFLATASLDLYAMAVGRTLGFDHVMATRAAWRDNRIAGGFDGANLRGDEKLAAVRRALARLQHNPSRIIAYSDHHSDLPLLRFADEGIAIDPTPKLAHVAPSYGLGIESWNK